MENAQVVVILSEIKSQAERIKNKLPKTARVQIFRTLEALEHTMGRFSDAVLLISDSSSTISSLTLLGKARDSFLIRLVLSDMLNQERMRELFLAGADDVLPLTDFNWVDAAKLFQVRLEQRNQNVPPSDGFETAVRRGSFIERSLAEGSLPVYYMNTNRIEYLRADVGTIDETSSSWRSIVISEWLREFGQNSSFVYLRPNPFLGLRLGAMVDIDEENRAVFRSRLSVRLDRYFAAIKRINCVAAASSCNAEYLDYSVASFLDRQNECLFFLDHSRYITSRKHPESNTADEELLDKFSRAIASGDSSMAASCVNTAVEHLCRAEVSPAFAFAHLNSLAKIIAIVLKTDEADYSLSPFRARNIFSLRDQLLDLVTRAKQLPGIPEEYEKKSSNRIQGVMKDIIRNPTLKYSAETTAQSLGYSRSHFCRLFSEVAGESFSAFVKQQKLNYALDLLMKTNFDIARIASIVGYGNTWYFRKEFEKMYGLSPEAFKAGKASESV